ncbi:MAG: S8 family serine peptidase [Candidatus Eremiobacteraeota bacterium]|nr:S8 family serine peptidase [Candidatus Eremiobacteraeota bacterium]
MNEFLKKILAGCIIIFLLAGCGGGGSSGGGSGEKSYVDGESIVRVDPGTDADILAEAYQATKLDDYRIGNNRYLRLSFSDAVPTKNNDLDNNSQVYSAEPNYIYNALEVPDDSYYSEFQYAPQLIGAESAWDGTAKDGDKILAVLDTGVNLTHPEFSGKAVTGYDFVGNREYPIDADYDNNGHGTHVAGIAAAIGNNGIGIAGISWGGKIMPVRVLDSSGKGSMSNLCKGIVYAVEHGADVICLCMGSSNFSYALQDAINYALKNDITVITGMGNDGNSAKIYPAASQGVIAVGSTNENDEHSSFSNTGPHISLCAPGSGIYSTYGIDGYKSLSGTSMAAGHISGACLLLLAIHPGMSPSQVKNQLESTAVDLGESGFDNIFGSGRLDLESAIDVIQPYNYGEAEVAVNYEGTVAPGANVILKDDEQNTIGPSLTNTLGIASFFSLKEGDYIAEVSYKGTTVISNLSVIPDGTTYLEVDVPRVEKYWTVMVYLDGDNDLESFGIEDMNEMETAGSTDDVNYVVQFDRISGGDTSNGNWTTTRRYYVTKDDNISIIGSQMIEDMGELNMGAPGTLVDFVTWAASEYPARNYMLVLWNHGGGFRAEQNEDRPPFRDICQDETNSGDWLTMAELKSALSDIYINIGRKIDILACDACLMGMIEVGYQVRNGADYLVASEEVEPGEGYPYDWITKDLNANPNMTPAQAGKMIVDNYIDYTGGECYSVMNLNLINPVASAVNTLAQKLQTDDPSQYTIGQIAKTAQSYYRNSDFRDLRGFTIGLRNNIDPGEYPEIYSAADDIYNLLAEGSDNFITYERHRWGNSYGVSIYLPSPAYNTHYSSSKYSTLDFAIDTQWNEFLQYQTNNY